MINRNYLSRRFFYRNKSPIVINILEDKSCDKDIEYVSLYAIIDMRLARYILLCMNYFSEQLL